MDGKFDFDTPITSDITLNAMWNCSNIDPNNPTLGNLKAALATSNPGAIYPIGTLIPDKWGDTDMRWRIVHYGKALDGTTSQEISGAYLMAETSSIVGAMNNFWAGSSIRNSMVVGGRIYVEFLSTEVKALATPIIIESVQATTVGTTTDSFFIPSCANLGGPNLASWKPSEWWDYFKQKMGGVTAWSNATPGRVLQNSAGTTITYWTRDASTTTYGYCIDLTGPVSGSSANQSRNIFTCFFMAS